MRAQPAARTRPARIPDSLKDDRSGMQRLEVMVTTVLERMTAVDEKQDGGATGHAA